MYRPRFVLDGGQGTGGAGREEGHNTIPETRPPDLASHLSGYVQTENIYLNANTEGDDQMAGWKFMEFFLSPEAQAMLADIGHIPAIAGVEVTDPLMLQAVEAFAGGAAFPVIPEMGAYWGPMDTALKSVFDEGADPAEALQAAYDSITAAIAEIRGGQ